MILALGAVLAFAAPTYQITHIGNLPGATGGQVTAINNNNVVVGYSTAGSYRTGFRWSQEDGMQDLNRFAYEGMEAHDINDNNRIVGWLQQGDERKGFYMQFQSGLVAVWHDDPLPGHVGSATRGVNNLGHTVGYSVDNAFSEHAAGWVLPYGGFLLPGNGLGGSSVAFRINDASNSVGYTMMDGEKRASLFLNSNQLVDLHTMLPAGATSSIARDINDQGVIVGDYMDPQDHLQSFVFNPELGMLYPVETGGFTMSNLNAVSGTGIAVGTISTAGRTRASRWTLDQGLVNLNDLIDPASGWTLKTAYGVNDAGYIVGVGVYQGIESNFMLTPVPEPATIVGLGLSVITLLRRKKANA